MPAGLVQVLPAKTLADDLDDRIAENPNPFELAHDL
jgi:hypothetical protein